MQDWPSMMTSGARRTGDAIGFINWPPPDCTCKDTFSSDCPHTWRDTSEGGMEAWLLVPAVPGHSVCITGINFSLIDYDVVISPAPGDCGLERFEQHYPLMRLKDNKSWEKRIGHKTYGVFSLIALIGSTGRSLWDVKNKDYFHVRRGDLTDQGRLIYDTVASIYCTNPVLMTALDT